MATGAEAGGWFGATFGALVPGLTKDEAGSAREQPPAAGAWFGWVPALPGLPLVQFSARGRETPSPPPASLPCYRARDVPTPRPSLVSPVRFPPRSPPRRGRCGLRG
jgi:hypothetical protein